ncbi:MAG: UvrD-helicase domain-containing protein [Oligoflexia bacterium]|nr:UvrD-helicase domain-containing protein [Oligoflexia bacterium]
MKSGFTFFSADSNWKSAYTRALELLFSSGGEIVLGPRIGATGETWLLQSYYKKKESLSGKKINTWNDWSINKIRSYQVEQSKRFQILSALREKDILFQVIDILSEKKLIEKITNYKLNPKFIDDLLAAIRETRMAGLIREDLIDRAKDLVTPKQNNVEQNFMEEFWLITLAFQSALEANQTYDRALALNLPFEETNTSPLYLLGFDFLHKVEIDFLQTVAKSREVIIPLQLSNLEIRDTLKSKKSISHSCSALLLQSLIEGFSGEISFKEQVDSEVNEVTLLSAHTPTFEARSAARFIKAKVESLENVFVVLPKNKKIEDTFLAELSYEFSEDGFLKKIKASESGLWKSLSNTLRLKVDNCTFFRAIELIRFLELFDSGISSLGVEAARAGVSDGFDHWIQLAEAHPKGKDVVSALQYMRDEFPQKGKATDFANALEDFFKRFDFEFLCFDDLYSQYQTESHFILGIFIRSTNLLAASTNRVFTIDEWLSELEALVSSASISSESIWPKDFFLSYWGEWLPPAEGSSFLCLQATQESISVNTANVILTNYRKKLLREFGFIPAEAFELEAIAYIRTINIKDRCFFSYSEFDSNGDSKELADVFEIFKITKKAKWNLLSPNLPVVGEFKNNREVILKNNAPTSFSPTFFENYEQCPFKAFVHKFLFLDDEESEASIDLSPLDKGKIYHSILEKFYLQYQQIKSKEVEWKNLLKKISNEVFEEFSFHYFRGSDQLLHLYKMRIEQDLKDFLEEDLNDYLAFAKISEVKVEQPLTVELPSGKKWKGKIDRVDIDHEKKKFIINDYKSGNPPENADIVTNIEKFQLPLYLYGLSKDWPEYEGIAGRYLGLRGKRLRNKGLFKKEYNFKKGQEEDAYYKVHPTNASLKIADDFDSIIHAYVDKAESIIKKSEEGLFSIEPKEQGKPCSYCSYKSVCRIREEEKLVSWASPESLNSLHSAFVVTEASLKQSRDFTEAQQKAIESKNSLVFIEASAGTGKTTVMVEKIKVFLKEQFLQMQEDASDSFYAISFTEKSAEELRKRLFRALSGEKEFSTSFIARVTSRVSTVHGLCAKIIADFPGESPVNPHFELLDEKMSRLLLEEVTENFFNQCPEHLYDHLSDLMRVYDRKKIASYLVTLYKEKLILNEEISFYMDTFQGSKNQNDYLLSSEASGNLLKSLFSLYKDFQIYVEEKKSELNVIDFNDLEKNAIHILQKSHCLEQVKKELKLVLIDEFQDTNSIQKQIVGSLSSGEGCQFVCVGDGKQSIYRFRNADIEVFESTKKDVKNNKGDLIELDVNYRSNRKIIQFVNDATSFLFPKESEEKASFEASAVEVKGKKEDEGRVVQVSYSVDETTREKTLDQESIVLVRLIQKLQKEGRALDQIAVLFKKISGNDTFFKALSQANIPYSITSSKGLFGQQITIDSVTLLRAVYLPESELALVAYLRSPWERKTEEEILVLRKAISEKQGLSAFVTKEKLPFLTYLRSISQFESISVIMNKGFEKYPLGLSDRLQIEKITAYLSALEESEKTRTEIIERFSEWSGWASDSEKSDEAIMPVPSGGGMLKIMTVHASKGLEFPVVILPDLGAAPSSIKENLRILPRVGICLRDPEEKDEKVVTEISEQIKLRDLAESKRQLYVAITRAEKEIYMLAPYGDKYKNKKNSWLDWLTEIFSKSSVVENEKSETFVVLESAHSSRITSRLVEHAKVKVKKERKLTTSEVVGYMSCAEFHKLKFIKKWEDLIVQKYKKHDDLEKVIRKRRARPGEIQKKLQSLGLERKDRGIILHRVLERVSQKEPTEETIRTWLRDEYGSFVSVENSDLDELVDDGVKTLQKLFSSREGRQIFFEASEVHSEFPFQFKINDFYLSGAIDRVVKIAKNQWIVVDYKSKITEENLAKYENQLLIYLLAWKRYLQSSGYKDENVSGLLIDLDNMDFYTLSNENPQFEDDLRDLLKKMDENYTLLNGSNAALRLSVEGQNACFSCPYVDRCNVGRNFVLRFS